jgi:hypothetical protein
VPWLVISDELSRAPNGGYACDRRGLVVTLCEVADVRFACLVSLCRSSSATSPLHLGQR